MKCQCSPEEQNRPLGPDEIFVSELTFKSATQLYADRTLLRKLVDGRLRRVLGFLLGMLSQKLADPWA